MRFVGKLRAYYNPCLTSVRSVDKLHAVYNPCLTPVWGSLTSYYMSNPWGVTPVWGLLTSSMSYYGMTHAGYNPCRTPVWGLLTSYTQITIHILLWYEVCWQVSYSGMRFVDKLHTDYNPYLTLVWGLLTSYTQTTIHDYRLQSMSYSGMRFVDKLHADYDPCLTPVWGLLTSYTQITIHVLLRYEVCWQVTRRLQSMSYSGMRFVDKLHTDYNPCLTPVWGLLTSYTQITIHVLLRYEVWFDKLHADYKVVWLVDKLHANYNPSYSGMRFIDKQTSYRLQSMSYSGMRFVDKSTIHVLLRYEVCWQVTHRLQSMSYSGMRFVDKMHTDYNPCLTPVWGLLTSYTQTTIHVLLRYEVRWKVTPRLQSMSYSGVRFVDKLHADYNNPCWQVTRRFTPVWGLLTSYTQTTIHVLLRYEVCIGLLTSYTQETPRIQSMSYSGMRFVDKLHADYNPCSYTQTTIHVLLQYGMRFVWGLLTSWSMYYSGMSYTDYNPCLTPVWGLLTSYTQITIHVLLRYEVCWQVTRRLQSMSYSGVRFVTIRLTPGHVTHRLQSMSYSGMRFVDKLHVLQTTIHVLLHGMRFVDKLHADYNPCLTPVCWQVTHRLQSMSYSGMTDQLHADYNPCLTPVWGLLTSYTLQSRKLQSMSYSGVLHVFWYEVCWQVTCRLQSVLLWYEVCWQVTRRLQSMSYSGIRFVDKLLVDYNLCLTSVWSLLTSYTQIQSMSYSVMRFVDKLHTDYNSCFTLVWGSLTSYTQITIHVLLWCEIRWQVTHRLQSMSYSCMRFFFTFFVTMKYYSK